MPFYSLITPTARWQRSLQWTTDELNSCFAIGDRQRRIR